MFAPPKGGKLRDVPLPSPVADALRAHMKRFPPVEITLPWKVADGHPVTKRLIFTGPRGGHVWRTSLNEEAWKPALAAAGVIPVPERGQPYAESRENGMHALRHFYASVLLDAGENIKAFAEYLGHSRPWSDAPRLRAPDAIQPGAHPQGSQRDLRTAEALASQRLVRGCPIWILVFEIRFKVPNLGYESRLIRCSQICLLKPDCPNRFGQSGWETDQPDLTAAPSSGSRWRAVQQRPGSGAVRGGRERRRAMRDGSWKDW
ncbi:hypothetical protein GCM10010391_65560 [Streptomyces anthocyanicus]|nr:hypothetical protein GCM10010391_65560 [Streptomyces anthocyanicus]